MPDLRNFDNVMVNAEKFHAYPAEFADEVLKRAIKFAGEAQVQNHGISDCNTLVSKHVDAQLTYFKSEDNSCGHPLVTQVERMADALEELAKAHAASNR